MAEAEQDPVIQELRARIAGLDRRVLEALNERLALVRRLKAHKDILGLDFHDPAQEERLLAALTAANAGPLSDPGLRAVFQRILAVIKDEASGPAGG